MRWNKTSEKIPAMETEMHGAMVSKKVLGYWDDMDYEVVQCQQAIGQDHVEWFNGVDVIEPPEWWAEIAFNVA